MVVLCPRCEREYFTPYGESRKEGDLPMPPALSRLDNKTYICSACGRDEGMRDFAGAPPIPPEEWPVAP
jgi:hypothetical protein